MNFNIKLLSALLFAFSIIFSSHAFTNQAAAMVVAQQCGCGNPKCSGCILGKLRRSTRPSRPSHQRPASKGCGCAECRAGAATQTINQQDIVTDVLVSQELLTRGMIPLEIAPQLVAPVPCGDCQNPGCSNCRLKKARPTRIASATPQADCDFCELKVEDTNQKLKFQKVEQKEICIPPVRLPWQKCCPPTRAKVRVVNVLKTDSCDCPTKKYTWKVHEPALPQSLNAEDSRTQNLSDSSQPTAKIEEVDPTPPKAPVINSPKLPDANKIDLNSVPRPPLEKK